ncbi:uncharacterized protein LOC123666777 [Melitaea cinxia]|nr:uncharacterized protein LOC123666777 [Melitaea cinxia]
MLKSKEWKNVTMKLNEIVGKARTDTEVKLAWKRMKLTAKANLSLHRREQFQTGGGQKPPSPSPVDLEIKSIAPCDFVVDVNNYDSDAVITIPPEIDDSPMPGSSSEYKEPILSADNTINSTNKEIKAVIDMPKNTEKKDKKVSHNRSEQGRQAIINSNIDFKKKQLEMLEVEHKFSVKISELKIKKLELEIELLENQKISIAKEQEKNNS